MYFFIKALVLSNYTFSWSICTENRITSAHVIRSSFGGFSLLKLLEKFAIHHLMAFFCYCKIRHSGAWFVSLFDLRIKFWLSQHFHFKELLDELTTFLYLLLSSCSLNLLKILINFAVFTNMFALNLNLQYIQHALAHTNYIPNAFQSEIIRSKCDIYFQLSPMSEDVNFWRVLGSICNSFPWQI